MIELIKITTGDFNESKIPLLFSETKANNNCAIITDGITKYRLAWHSDMIDPVILRITYGIYGIGVDQHFSIINFEKKEIPCTLNLMYNFLNAEIFDEWIFIITELEIIKMDKNSLGVLAEYALPDFFEEIQFSYDGIKVSCSGGINIYL